MPERVVEDMRDAGLFHMAAACDAGGIETAPVDLCRAIEEVSAADGSAGWCLMIASQNAAIGGFLDRAVAAEVYGNRQDCRGRRAPHWPGGDAARRWLPGQWALALRER